MLNGEFKRLFKSKNDQDAEVFFYDHPFDVVDAAFDDYTQLTEIPEHLGENITVHRMPRTSGSTQYIFDIFGYEIYATIDIRAIGKEKTRIRIRLAEKREEMMGIIVMIYGLLMLLDHEIEHANSESKDKKPEEQTLEKILHRTPGRRSKEAYDHAFSQIHQGLSYDQVYQDYINTTAQTDNAAVRAAFTQAMAYRRKLQKGE